MQFQTNLKILRKFLFRTSVRIVDRMPFQFWWIMVQKVLTITWVPEVGSNASKALHLNHANCNCWSLYQYYFNMVESSNLDHLITNTSHCAGTMDLNYNNIQDISSIVIYSSTAWRSVTNAISLWSVDSLFQLYGCNRAWRSACPSALYEAASAMSKYMCWDR